MAIGANSSASAAVTCPLGEVMIGGGHSWFDNENGTAIIDSSPSEGDPNRTWIVTGRAETSSNTLFAWANCLAT